MTTNSTTFLCNNCGASLNVQSHTRFCTCSFCGSNLKIRKERGTIFSEVLDDIQKRTVRIEENVLAIRLHQELETLDREWELEVRRLSTANKDGSYSVPNKWLSIATGVFAFVLGLFWIVKTVDMEAPPLFSAFGLIVIGFAIYAIIKGVRIADEFNARKRVYYELREEIMKKIQESD